MFPREWLLHPFCLCHLREETTHSRACSRKFCLVMFPLNYMPTKLKLHPSTPDQSPACSRLARHWPSTIYNACIIADNIFMFTDLHSWLMSNIHHWAIALWYCAGSLIRLPCGALGWLRWLVHLVLHCTDKAQLAVCSCTTTFHAWVWFWTFGEVVPPETPSSSNLWHCTVNTNITDITISTVNTSITANTGITVATN